MTSERVCVIHVGTHKTGTTTQQYFLMQHAEEFAREGLLFPKTGWYGVVPGHHALAWELVTENSGPIFRALLEEMRASGLPSAVISAEDFSLLGDRPEALNALAQGLRSIGYTPKIVVYLRAQGPFAESMYVERVKHDHIRPVGAFIDEVLATGRYNSRGSGLTLEFHYARMLAPFAEVFGRENILVRTYAGMRDVSLVFIDFLRVLAHFTGIYRDMNLNVEISHRLINESLSFIRLLGTAFTRLKPNEAVAATVQEFAATYASDLPQKYLEQRFALFERADHEAILRSVVEDNREVEKLYGVRVPFTTDADIPPPTDPVWAKAAIERAIYDRCIAAWSEEQTHSNNG